MAWTVESWRKIPGLEQRFGDRIETPAAGVTALRQVHGRRVWRISEITSPSPEGDGLLVDRVGECAGVWTADCVPVHLVAPRARVASAIHSGWRGTVAGVVDAALERLDSEWSIGPGEVEVALGPAIDGCCYEVGVEVRTAFAERYGTSADRGFEYRDGRLFLDLRDFLCARLEALGVRVVGRFGPCTACRTDLLYSYRKEKATGRQLSWIGWREVG